MKKSGLKLIAPLGALFLAASGMVGAATRKQLPAADSGPTYWKNEYTGSIVEIFKCAATGFCMRTRFIDVANPNGRKHMAGQLGIPLDKVTDDDLRRFCGFGPRFFDMKQTRAADGPGDPGDWEGKFKVSLDRIRGKGDGEGRTFGIKVERLDESRLKLTGWIDTFLISLVKKSTELVRVTDPPPACAPPPLTPLENR